MYIVTRGNNKILRTILAALKRYSTAQLVVPFPNSEQINHPFSNHNYKSRRQITSITTMPPLYTHTPDIHYLFNCTHISTTLSPLDLWTDPAGVTVLLARWTEKLAGGSQTGRSVVGRQQQQEVVAKRKVCHKAWLKSKSAYDKYTLDTAQESKLQELTADLQSESGRKSFMVVRHMAREGRDVINVCCMKMMSEMLCLMLMV